MDQFLSFVMENWRFLVEVILTLVVLLIAIIKKKVSVNVPTTWVSLLPTYISEAERKFSGEKTGKQKLRYVVECCLKYVQTDLGVDLSKESNFISYIVEQVEEILSCPSKKEK